MPLIYNYESSGLDKDKHRVFIGFDTNQKNTISSFTLNINGDLIQDISLPYDFTKNFIPQLKI